MNYLSLFSGIGAFEKSLDRLKQPYNLVNYCEFDKYASKSYSLIHNIPETLNLGDITKIDITSLKEGQADIITYGFPCQDISLSGKMAGFHDENGQLTRSGLFFYASAIIGRIKPKVAIAENVKNLTSKKFEKEFKIVLDSLEELGYNNYWKVLNAKDYGIPQNRERVFIVSIRKDVDTKEFKFPESFPLELRLKDMLEDEVDEKFYINKKWHFSTDEDEKHDSNEIGQIDGIAYKATRSITDTNMICRTLDTMGGGQREPKIIDTSVMKVGNVNPSGKGMNGTVIDSDGLARTITQEKGEGQKVLIRQATKQGYAECEVGGVADLSYPNSKTRRGRVQEGGNICPTITAESNGLCRIETGSDYVDKKYKEFENKNGYIPEMFNPYNCSEIKDIAPTLTAQGNSITKSGTVLKVEPFIVASRGRNPENPSDRTVGSPTVQRLEPNLQGLCNTLTTVQKDNYVVEPVEYFEKLKFVSQDGSSVVEAEIPKGNYKNIFPRIRKLTPKECWRLMGFDDEDIDKCIAGGISNTQLYKQAGNSIVVNVLECLFKSLFEAIPSLKY